MHELGPTYPTDVELEGLLANPSPATLRFLRLQQRSSRRSRDRIMLAKLIELMTPMAWPEHTCRAEWVELEDRSIQWQCLVCEKPMEPPHDP